MSPADPGHHDGSQAGEPGSAAPNSPGAGAGTVHGAPSEELARAAAVAAVIAVQQVRSAAEKQAEAERRHRAGTGFASPSRRLRGSLPTSWTTRRC